MGVSAPGVDEAWDLLMEALGVIREVVTKEEALALLRQGIEHVQDWED